MELTTPGSSAEDIATAMCNVHPRQISVADCASCGTHLCALCSFDLKGKSYCSDCAVAAAGQAGLKVCPECGLSIRSSVMRCDCGHDFGLLNLSAPPRRDVVSSGKCVDHPEVDAVVRCRLCGKSICSTCDFAMPGGVHVCPSCIESQSTEDVSPKRKKHTYIALALASWATILMALLFGGAFNSLFTPDAGGKAADLLITNVILWPLLIGTGLSIGALDKRLKNTGLMKGVAWWNGILAGLFLLLVIAVNTGLIGK